MVLVVLLSPAYPIINFINACRNRNIHVHREAKKNARDHFSLYTPKVLVEFIANGGLEELTHEHRKEWGNCPIVEKPIEVDSYEFRSGGQKGYIAFFYRPKKQRWEIKSFKPHIDSNLALYDGLKILK